MNDMVALVIDTDLCIGVGLCELHNAATFRLDDDSGVAELIGNAKLSLKRAEAAVDRCPSGAISIPPDSPN